MYRLSFDRRNDERRYWALPDRQFFACGACHILAYAFLEKHRLADLKALWIKPAKGFIGNHIFVTAQDWVFDYHGYSRRENFLAHTTRKAKRWYTGWDATFVELAPDVLISESKSKTYDGLWLREPTQFLHDALPRARAFISRFPAPNKNYAAAALLNLPLMAACAAARRAMGTR